MSVADIPPIRQVCVQGEESNSNDLNGVYQFHSYNNALQTNVYYKEDNQLYVYPYTYSNGNKYWFIGSNASSIFVSAYAPTNEGFHIEETSGQWVVYNINGN